MRDPDSDLLRTPEDEALRAVLRQALPPAELPPWFSAGLQHAVRLERRASSGGGWFGWLPGLLRVRVLGLALVLAVLTGAWSGYRGARLEALHLAEARYANEVDPVHLHP